MPKDLALPSTSGTALPSCPVDDALRLLGGKWRLLVLFRLLDGPQRFNALQRSLAPVTQKVLTAALRGLERDGLAWRRVEATVPPHVTYGPTARARALAPVFEALAAWRLSAPPADAQAPANLDAID
jgi:DNA-binding HxlR family transcriptional regulator